MHAKLVGFLQLLSLSTPQLRLATWLVLTAVIFIAPFHWLTDLSLYKRFGLEWAPSVGLTRAYWFLIHGDATAAWRMNSLIFVVVGVGGAVLLKDVWQLARKHEQ